MATFEYTKEMLFSEFADAKAKDIKLSKKKTYEEKENDIHKNRIKLLSEYVELEKTNPEVFDNVNINFKNLLFAYQQPNPRDYFYFKVFGKSYSQKAAEDAVVDVKDYSDEDKNAKTLEEKVEAMV